MFLKIIYLIYIFNKFAYGFLYEYLTLKKNVQKKMRKSKVPSINLFYFNKCNNISKSQT